MLIAVSRRRGCRCRPRPGRCAAARTVSAAAAESAGSASVAKTMARPSTTLGVARVRRVGQRRRPAGPPGRRRAGRCRGGADQQADHVGHLGPPGTTICTGLALSAWKCASRTSWACTDSTSVRKKSVCGIWSSLSVVTKAARHEQADEGADPDRPGAAADQPSQPAPETLGVGVLGAERAASAARRPAGPAAPGEARSSRSAS